MCARDARLFPDLGVNSCLVGARTIVAAATAIDGNVENVPKFMDTFMHIKFPSPKSDISLDKNTGT